MDLLVMAGETAVWGAALLAFAVVLALVTWRTAQRPAAPVPQLGEFFARWAAVHDGYDPRQGSLWVRGWLIMVYRLARPLSRAGCSPDVLTLWTVWLALAVVAAAAAGGSWPALAGWLVLFGGVGDALDGAVAVLTNRATRWGYVLDSAVDRCNDVLFAIALVVVGGPAWLAAVYALLLFELEYIRARAGNAGGSPIGAITVGERANRVVFCGVGLFAAGVFPDRAAAVATATLGLLVCLSAAGVAQLVVAVRRDLGATRSGGPDQLRDDGRRQGDQRHPTPRM